MNSKYLIYCFSTDLPIINERLDLKKSADLMKEWDAVPKEKLKLYSKLYFKLLKSKIIKKKAPTNKWIINKNTKFNNIEFLNHPKLANYNCFSGKHLKGYTRHGEKIYTYINTHHKNSDINKLKKYYLQ